MNKNNKILSDVIVHMKYAKYKPELQRRETWGELVARNMEMHIKKYPSLESQIRKVYKEFVLTKRVLPSMRSLQFGGKAIEVNNARIYNCCYLPLDSVAAFSETMFLLLSGTGVGFSVAKDQVAKFPEIKKPNPERSRRYLIEDSIMGWADAIKVLLQSYTGKLTSTVRFDYSDIREKGAMLVTSGGKAPGAGPLRIAIAQITAILEGLKEGDKLTPLQAHDIACFIADSVLAGGIRRSAMISFFDDDDEEMATSKSGAWWEKSGQRARSNNSVMLERNNLDYSKFKDLWEFTKNSKAGEPGFYLTNNKSWGSNPCVEIGLRPFQMCNLVEINGMAIHSQDEFNEVAGAAGLLATLQAGYTDFHYLRDIWKTNTEKDALIGVSITGLANPTLLGLDFKQAANEVETVNILAAGLIGINEAARRTCVKPAGTTSLVLGTSSGIHAWHSEYYIRRVRIGKDEALYTHLAIHHPELLEDDIFAPNKTAVISVPQKAPEGAMTRAESPIDLLERVKKVSQEWIKPGHTSGANSHNVSCTISLKDDEWDTVRDWMWANKDYYNGISVLPFDGGTYQQAPFEETDKDTYERLTASLEEVDLTKVVELADNTDLSGEVACGGGGSCEVI